MTETFVCCDHCEHDVNDPPHTAPCPEECHNDVFAEEWADFPTEEGDGPT